MGTIMCSWGHRVGGATLPPTVGSTPTGLTNLIHMVNGEERRGVVAHHLPLFLYIYIFCLKKNCTFLQIRILTEGGKLTGPQIFLESGPGWPESSGGVLSKLWPP